MAGTRFNGWTRWVLGVIAGLVLTGAAAVGAHMANGEIHETSKQKRDRITSQHVEFWRATVQPALQRMEQRLIDRMELLHQGGSK